MVNFGATPALRDAYLSHLGVRHFDEEPVYHGVFVYCTFLNCVAHATVLTVLLGRLAAYQCNTNSCAQTGYDGAAVPASLGRQCAHRFNTRTHNGCAEPARTAAADALPRRRRRGPHLRLLRVYQTSNPLPPLHPPPGRRQTSRACGGA